MMRTVRAQDDNQPRADLVRDLGANPSPSTHGPNDWQNLNQPQKTERATFTVSVFVFMPRVALGASVDIGFESNGIG